MSARSVFVVRGGGRADHRGRRTAGVLRCAALVLLIGLAATPLSAQDLDRASTERLAWGGILGAGAGWLAGALAVGVPLAYTNPFGSDQLDDEAWTPGLVIGFELGQALAIPLAVHHANEGKGQLHEAMLASMALGVAGTVLLWTDDLDALFEERTRPAVLIVVPVAQIVSSIYFARREAFRGDGAGCILQCRKRAGAARPQTTRGPNLQGGVA